jgi:2-desacetyl-2-hydroxyethyl bacteriochlorophyllide A dehydrogenase
LVILQYSGSNTLESMLARQAVIVEPHRVDIRSVELPPPAANQILVRTFASAISPGTELAVYTGAHQWLRDPAMQDWKFPFRPGYSAAGEIVSVGGEVSGWKVGDLVSYPGNHASAELLTIGHERGRLWRLPSGIDPQPAAWSCIARYGFGAAIRVGVALGRSAAVLGLGVIGQFALRSLKAAGAHPVIGIDAVEMRRNAALAGGANVVIAAETPDLAKVVDGILGTRGADVVADATGVPDAIPTAMKLACDGGQVVVVGSPRGIAANVNFYDDLHRRYLEVTGAHGNMLFEANRHRIPGNWDIDKAQHWLLEAIRDGRLKLDGLVTHSIAPDQLAPTYEGLLHRKNEYLGVVIRWD